MIKILIIKDTTSAPSNQFYRSVVPINILEQDTKGIYQVSEKFKEEIRPEIDFYQYSVVYMEKPINAQSLSLLDTAKKSGCRVIIDYDDNVFNIPPYNKSRAYYINQRNSHIISQCLSLADMVIVATPALEKVYKGFNKNVRVIPNAWNDYLFQLNPVRPIGKPIHMVTRASESHKGDFDGVLGPLSANYKDPHFKWTMYGYTPYQLNATQLDTMNWAPLPQFFNRFFQSPIDFMFVPLEVNEFNKGKSNIAWIEATIAGGVVIAPMGLPEFDQPGIIRYKDNKHLKDILQKIKKGGYDKKERVEASREALQDFRLTQVNRLRVEAIADLCGIKLVAEEVKAE